MKPFGLKNRRWNRRAIIGLCMMLPAILWLALVYVLPLFQGIHLSFHEVVYGKAPAADGQEGAAAANAEDAGPASAERRGVSDTEGARFSYRYVGLEHFRTILRRLRPDEVFGISALNTLIWAFFVTALQFAVGLGIALFLSQPFRGNRFVRTLVLVPWITPPIVAGLSYQWLYNGDFGLLRSVFGVGVDLLGSRATALPACIWVAVWRGYGLFMIILLAGLLGVPKSRYEAASIDGAGPIGRFLHVSLPALRPLVMVLVLLGMVWNLNSFDLVYIMTRGGPNNATQLVPITLYQQGVENGHYGLASAFGMLAFGFNLVLAGVFVFLRRPESEE